MLGKRIRDKARITTNYTIQLLLVVFTLTLVAYFIFIHMDIISRIKDLNRPSEIGDFLSLSLFLALLIGQTYMALTIARKNREIEGLAYYDSVTKLQNRGSFMKLLEDQLKASKKEKRALILINCSGISLMKLIFDRQILDRLFLDKANALRRLNISNDYLFRYSEDSFLVYIKDYKDRDELKKISDQILMLLDSREPTVECDTFESRRVGILEMGDEDKEVDEVIRHLELITSKIREPELDKYWFFSDDIQRELMMDKLIEKELIRAANDGFDNEFYLEYQPLVELGSNRVVGLEALARWRNKELGIVSPYKFIEIAERTQLIIPFGEWVMATALGFLKELEYNELDEIKLAVNISVVQLLQDDFINGLMNIVEKEDIKPQRLELEITESKFMHNYELNNKKLNSLRRLGITIALDDFGTGYSSLARLRSLNIDVIKIDRAFIENILNPYEEDIFVKSIIVLANQLNLKVVAEGVETEEQKQYLASENCHVMQGYLFSRPLSAEKAVDLIKKNNLITP
ncbi:MAG: bifunctional diguanylate cyclase/phosphodiesterase [Tissierellaceae bacterium]